MTRFRSRLLPTLLLAAFLAPHAIAAATPPASLHDNTPTAKKKPPKKPGPTDGTDGDDA